ncbi:MAG: Trm112 family protein [Alphaproteobacteria bacterium]|nr:Trm112 family protein [Alphaproteobacteria bacterium]
MTKTKKENKSTKPQQQQASIKLIEALVCPITGGALQYDKENNELISNKAKLAFPIIENIPIMLESEARNLKN